MRLLFFSLFVLSIGCSSTPEKERGFAAEVAAAHGERSLYALPPLHAGVTVDFGGARVLDARMTYHAASGRVRLDYADGRVAVFDGEAAWAQGFSEEELSGARFDLLTWPYFVAAPWKLGDPGARLGPTRERELAGAPQASARLTFADGVGDTPDDWYVVYADPDDKRLTALAYVVTYGTTLEKATAEPHAATYEEWKTVEGLRLPARLTFWVWSESEGLVGEPIGSARFTDLRFAPAPEGAFTAPAGSERARVP